MQPDIKDRAVGRWRGILAGLGMDAKGLSGRHGPCPICGGKDRFRFDDKEGRGTFFCSQCGSGNGVDLVMRWKNVIFIEAKKMIEGQIGTAPVVVPAAARDDGIAREQMAALWTRARPLDGLDIASRYLSSRGLSLPSWPPVLRWVAELKHLDDDRAPTFHPAMLAKFVASDDKSAILHRTWLAEPGVKAPVDKPRKMMPGKIPDGGALRLFPAGETLGIAEGIETALSAHVFWQIPVWAALTAGALMKWKAPKVVKNIIIFGDADASFTGQAAAYALAHRLKTEGFQVEVRFTIFYDTGQQEDWSDCLMNQTRAAA